MHLLHISDPHFSIDYFISPDKVREGLELLIKDKISDPENLFLLITGDITFKANPKGFEEGAEFFNQLLKNTGIKRENFLVCPGNHDINKTISGKNFDTFNSFAYTIRGDASFCFNRENSNNIYFRDSCCFLSINTIYNLDHSYGKIDTKNLLKLLNKNKENIAESDSKIILCHHHILNSEDQDASSIKNAYQFIEMIKDFGFNFLFHGHQHARKNYKINDLNIIGMSSLLESERRVVTNLIVGLHKINENNELEKQYFKYLGDVTSSDCTQGSFINVG